MKRRNFINALAALSGVGVLTGLYTWQVEPFWLEFVKVKMPIKNLPEHLTGKTLMQISDVHVGNRFEKDYIIDSFQKAQKYKPDFVVYTGDFVNYESEEQFEQLEEVFQHVVLGSLGTIGILGNHDYGQKWAEIEVANSIVDILSEKGISMLRNEQKTVAGLNFVGLDDYWAINFYPEKVMQHINHDIANIVLCHNPDVADQPVWNGYKGWILCGHTHGGQCKPPFLKPPMLPVKNKRYTAGIIELSEERIMYINRALGHLWQVRFNVRPEITIFELEKA
jgi:predicted MPP superfamily phosphohydrolase